MNNPLLKKIDFKFTLSVWQILSVAWLVFLLPYIAWEIFWYQRAGIIAIKAHTQIVLLITCLWFAMLVYMRFFKVLKKPLSLTGLGIAYVLLSLKIGEIHPFTQVPMYSMFGKSAVSYKVTDEKGKLVPIRLYYKNGSGFLAHIASNLKLDTRDSNSILKKGPALFEALQSSQINAPPADSLKLFVETFYLDNGKIANTENLIYDGKVKQ